MTSDRDDASIQEITDEFEQALQTLVLEAFATGARVRGTREIAPASSAVPNWRVTIEKVTDAEPPEGGAAFIDE